jgi:prevent-host-death family protein
MESLARTSPPTVSALHARANLGKLLDHVENEGQSLVIEKRGVPKAVLVGIQDYVKLAAPEPAVLRIIGEESRRNGTHRMSTRQIEQIIKSARKQRKEKRKR